MRVRAVCPRCGAVFYVDVDLSKGKGAHYGRKIKRLGGLHRLILGVLAEARFWDFGDGRSVRGLTKRELSRILYRRGHFYSGNSISGRLSELLSLGYVGVDRVRVKLYDAKQQKFRFVKKPVWYITEAGVKALSAEPVEVRKE